jgi:hypothetical protein
MMLFTDDFDEKSRAAMFELAPRLKGKLMLASNSLENDL